MVALSMIPKMVLSDMAYKVLAAYFLTAPAPLTPKQCMSRNHTDAMNGGKMRRNFFTVDHSVAYRLVGYPATVMLFLLLKMVGNRFGRII